MPTVALDVPSAHVLADQASIIQDLQFVMDCCKRLLTELEKPEEDRDPLMPVALWSSAVLAYARCFGKGKRFSLVTEDVRNLPLHGAVMKFHKWVLEERDKLAAHAPNPSEAAKVGAALSPPEQKDRRVEGIVIFASEPCAHRRHWRAPARRPSLRTGQADGREGTGAAGHRAEGRPAAEPGQLVPAAGTWHLAARRRRPIRRRPIRRRPRRRQLGDLSTGQVAICSGQRAALPLLLSYVRCFARLIMVMRWIGGPVSAFQSKLTSGRGGAFECGSMPRRMRFNAPRPVAPGSPGRDFHDREDFGPVFRGGGKVFAIMGTGRRRRTGTTPGYGTARDQSGQTTHMAATVSAGRDTPETQVILVCLREVPGQRITPIHRGNRGNPLAGPPLTRSSWVCDTRRTGVGPVT